MTSRILCILCGSLTPAKYASGERLKTKNNMDKSISLSIIAAVVIIGGAIWLSGSRTPLGGQERGVLNATSTILDGKQYIDITARGGYSPRQISAKAGMPTVIRMKTEGTFDCSSFLVIPALGYRNALPQSGVTEIPVPVQSTSGILRGTCGMGMYSFAIDFK